MVINSKGMGDTTFGIPTSPATLNDCETSWDPLVGLQCIASGQILQQISSSLISPSLTPGIFLVTSASDPNNPNVSSSDASSASGFSTLLWAGIIGLGVVIVFKVMK